MAGTTYDPKTGKFYPTWMLEAMDNLTTKMRTRPLWEGIDFIVKIYHRRFPGQAVQTTEAHRKAMANDFGSNKQKDMRHLLEVPEMVRDLIEYFYDHEIEDKKQFWRTFAKRYPEFRVAERV